MDNVNVRHRNQTQLNILSCRVSVLVDKARQYNQGWDCSSVVEWLPHMHEVLGSILQCHPNKQSKTKILNMVTGIPKYDRNWDRPWNKSRTQAAPLRSRGHWVRDGVARLWASEKNVVNLCFQAVPWLLLAERCSQREGHKSNWGLVEWRE